MRALDFGSSHLHYKHIWRNVQYEQEEGVQRGKPVSVSIWAPDYCFNRLT